MRRFVLLLLLTPLFMLGGCVYLLKQSTRQIGMLLSQRDINSMLADPTVHPTIRVKLELVGRIKDYGKRHLGLTPGSNYTSYYDTGGKPVTYLVSACRKDRFEPYVWWFPIVGSVPYKGFFDRDDAVAEARRLKNKGWDVALSGASAYSTLGYFSDPVLSTMLDLPEERLAALLLHEMTHTTIYITGETDFNEGLASFVGWQGAIEYIREYHGIDSPTYARTVQLWASTEKGDQQALELFKKLDAFYRSDVSTRVKINLREVIAGFPVNNAEILMQRRYGGFDEFKNAFMAAGALWPEFFEDMRKRHAPKKD